MPKRGGSNVIDLMAALKKSIEKPGAKAAGRRRSAAPAKKARREEGAGRRRSDASGPERWPRQAADPLATYNAKRDFAKTAEPAGKVAQGQAATASWSRSTTRRRLHYDFRLELDGMLKSWAVTRGPSLDPADKRLAVRTEDHPLSYATFEGTIPKGEYGGGTVMLWDRGTLDAGARQGPAQDARGRPSPLHPRRRADEGRMGDVPAEAARQGARRELDAEEGRRRACRQPDRADRHVSDLGQDRPDDGRDRGGEEGEGLRVIPAKAGSPGRTSRRRHETPAFAGATASLPKFREPQKATLVDHVPAGAGWLHEMKYDGYRCLLALAGGKAKIYTRTGLDWTDKFPEIAEAARGARRRTALLDGEIVALDDKGNTGFSALQQAISRGRARAHPVPVRRARDRRRGSRQAAQYRAQGAARRAARRGRAALHPLCRPYPRQGRAIVRGDVRGGPGRDHLEEGRRALSRTRGPRTGSRSNAPGARNSSSSAGRESDKKGRGFRSLLLGAQRGRQAALRRQGRHRLLAGRPARSARAARQRSRPTRPPAAGAPRRGARRALGEAQAGRRDRLRRVHRRQCRPPRQLPRPARRQEGEGGGRGNARSRCPSPPRTMSRSAIPTG